MAPPAEVVADDWTTVTRSFVVRRRTTAKLRDDGTALSIGNATIATKGLSGTVSTYFGKKGRDEAGQQVTTSLTDALAGAGIEVKQTLTISAAAETGPPSRSVGDRSALELELSDPGEGFGQMVMAADELGVVSWHFAPPEMRGASRGAVEMAPRKTQLRDSARGSGRSGGGPRHRAASSG